MKKLKRLWRRIPRKVRAIGNLLAALLVATVFYVCIGSPTSSEVQAFRRAEKANLLGPSTILLDTDLEYYYYDHLILAETDDCVITYVGEMGAYPTFCYTEKTGDVTVVTPTRSPFSWGNRNEEVNMPVFIVDDVPEAVRAELEIHILGSYKCSSGGEAETFSLNHRYCLESRREGAGYFRFSINLPSLEPYDKFGNYTDARHGADGFALDLLADTFSNTNNWLPYQNASITATARLYDDQDQLIVQREMTLREMTEES